MKTVKGDLLTMFSNGDFDVIVHGCNCGNNMGAGIARQIRERFPAAWDVDRMTKKWDRDKLGSFTQAEIEGVGVVVNAYTQFSYSGAAMNCDYDAVRNAFKQIKIVHGGQGKRFGIPLIGAGLARGDWSIISAIIAEEMEGEDLTVVEYDPTSGE